MNDKLVNELTVKMYAHVAKMFNEDEAEENFIDLSEIADNNNGNEFMHVLANVVPKIIYELLSDDKNDLLAFNHTMNRIICQTINFNQVS